MNLSSHEISWALAYLSKDFTVPVDVVRVQFNVDCLFHPAWAEMGIMINKLYLIPEQAESGIVSMLWNSQGAFIWQTFLMKKDSSLAIFLAGKWGMYVAHSRCLLATFLCGPVQCCIWSNVAFGVEQTAKQLVTLQTISCSCLYRRFVIFKSRVNSSQ